MPLRSDLPIWPDSPGIRVWDRLSLERGDAANVTQLELDVHSGTHIDAPRHILPQGARVDDVGLMPFIGPAFVVSIPEARRIDSAILEALEVPSSVTRLLLRTSNSNDPRYRSAPFRQDYAALTVDGAQWVANRGFQLVGIDYLSIQLYEDSPDTHRVLLGAGVCVLEGLVLADISPGNYFLACLPIALPGAEAAPARAVLFQQSR